MSARIINLHTGQVTPLTAVWSDTDHTPICEYCGTYEPFCTCGPETYHCEDCGEVLTDEEVNKNVEYDMDRWTCSTCDEQSAIDDWLNRSHEAQDRAVLRGMG